jgi:hypothetical protein
MENATSFESQGEFQADFNPLQENVKQRPYTRPNVEIVDVTPIAEPIFTPPSFEELQNGFEAQNGGGQGAKIDDRQVWGQSDEDMGNANPYVEQLDKKDQKMASSALADAVLDGYSQLNGFGNKLVQFDPNKIEDLMRKGEIDPNITLPINGQNIGILDYVNEYNSQTKDVISVSPEFIDKVRPVLVRVLMKRGIGMTDEQLLAYYFGIDILTKGATIYGLRKQNASLLEALKDMSSGAPRSTPPPSQPTQPTQPTQQQYSEPEPEARQEVKQERQYVEPEEVVVIKEEPIQEAVVVDEPIRRSRQTRPAPKFGDEAILQQMEDIANGKVTKPRGRRKK